MAFSSSSTMSVDLPKDTFIIHDFLAASLYSYPNKKTGKRLGFIVVSILNACCAITVGHTV